MSYQRLAVVIRYHRHLLQVLRILQAIPCAKQLKGLFVHKLNETFREIDNALLVCQARRP